MQLTVYGVVVKIPVTREIPVKYAHLISAPTYSVSISNTQKYGSPRILVNCHETLYKLLPEREKGRLVRLVSSLVFTAVSKQL